MPHAVQNQVLPHDIVAHPIDSNSQAPLPNASTLQLLHVRRWAEGFGFEKLECLSGELSSQAPLQIVLERDGFPCRVLLRRDPQALLEGRIKLLDEIVEVIDPEEDRRGFAALRDHEASLPVADLPKERPELGSRNCCWNGCGYGCAFRHFPPLVSEILINQFERSRFKTFRKDLTANARSTSNSTLSLLPVAALESRP